MAAERIQAMIQFTKEYENVGVRDPVWQDVRKVVEREARHLVQPPIKLENEIPPGMEMYADPLIAKVFHNLMENATRHGGKITTLSFRIEVRGNVRAIICEDDGFGISAERKKDLFTHTSKDGHGFGLFLSREIEAITGITMSEEGELGKGAKFVMTLPLNGFRMV
jgi:signal transduction histidine kinase